MIPAVYNQSAYSIMMEVTGKSRACIPEGLTKEQDEHFFYTTEFRVNIQGSLGSCLLG